MSRQRLVTGVLLLAAGAFLLNLIRQGAPGSETFGVSGGWWFFAVTGVLLIGASILVWVRRG